LLIMRVLLQLLWG